MAVASDEISSRPSLLEQSISLREYIDVSVDGAITLIKANTQNIRDVDSLCKDRHALVNSASIERNAEIHRALDDKVDEIYRTINDRVATIHGELTHLETLAKERAALVEIAVKDRAILVETAVKERSMEIRDSIRVALEALGERLHAMNDLRGELTDSRQNMMTRSEVNVISTSLDGKIARNEETLKMLQITMSNYQGRMIMLVGVIGSIFTVITVGVGVLTFIGQHH